MQLTTNSGNDLVCQMVKMVESDGYYIYNEEVGQIQELMKNEVGVQIQSLLENETVMILPSKEFAGRHSIGDELIIQIEKVPTEDKGAEEWDDKVYRKWSKECGIQIFITPQNVSTSVVFKTSEKIIKKFGFKDGTDGFVKNKKIVLKDPFPKKVSQLLTDICERDDYKWFHQPFIQYLSMVLNAEDDESEVNDTTATGEDGRTHRNNNPNVRNGSGNISVKDENKDVLKILDEWATDLLDWVKDNKEAIKHLKENPDSHVKKISGYLGEQLYYQYMKIIGKEVEDITDKGFADYKIIDGVVDVKTNIGSMKSEAKPIHLHKATQKYLDENSGNQLFIFHISLEDVGIEPQYRELEKKYGEHADPRKNDVLRKECDDLVKEFLGNGANARMFEKKCSEYLIKTPLK